MLALETIMNEMLWVVRDGGYRELCNKKQIERHFARAAEEDADIECLGISVQQPEHLQKFFDAYFEYEKTNSNISVPDFYTNVYAVSKRTWTEDQIKNLIQTNDKVLYRALKKLYACQTDAEKSQQATVEHNGVGFNAIDGEFMSSLAEFLIHRGYLTDKQKMIARKKLIKYNKQLTRLANAS